MIQGLLGAVTSVTKANKRNDDDLIDRLHHQYTVTLLVLFAVLVSTTQYVGNPIHCWCPATFTGNHQEYANRLCWVSDTYYIPESAVPDSRLGALRQHIGYYQWVPVFLLLQASLFFLPSFFWRIFSERSGININNLVEAADTIQNALYPERRDKTIKYMIRHLDHYLEYQREYRGGCCVALKGCMAKHACLPCGNRHGNYLLLLYIGTKTLYLANALLQLFLLNGFLGNQYHLYGIQLVYDLVTGSGWSRESKRFPRITLCDFEIRQMGNTHRHTVQCVLPINFFNEKIFIFLWFWFVFVAVATCFSLARWTCAVGFRCTRTWYVRKHLKVMDRYNRDNDRDNKLVTKFVESYLRHDGVFVLKLVAKNSTDLVVADIVASLWDNYRNKPLRTGDRGTATYDAQEEGEVFDPS